MNGDVSWLAIGGVGTIVTLVFMFMTFLWNRHNGIYKTIAELRIEVAKNYVENKTLERVEERLERSITKLGDRLEILLRALVNKGDLHESK